jgi:putative PIN family toxin of toxin-antitoxin system
MLELVVDTNVIVSGLINNTGSCARVVDMILRGEIIASYDSRILSEYQDVLTREQFGFDSGIVKGLIAFIQMSSPPVVSVPIVELWPDEDDKKFLEVAKAAAIFLITGNQKHYPKDSRVLSVAEFFAIVDSEDIDG